MTLSDLEGHFSYLLNKQQREEASNLRNGKYMVFVILLYKCTKTKLTFN